MDLDSLWLSRPADEVLVTGGALLTECRLAAAAADNDDDDDVFLSR